MYYPLYNNPFYYPNRAYIPNMCSYNHAYENINNRNNFDYNSFSNSNFEEKNNNRNIKDISFKSQEDKNIPFSITDDRLELFGISINIDDLIILITLFFMFKESHIDYSIIIILALILFDQN